MLIIVRFIVAIVAFMLVIIGIFFAAMPTGHRKGLRSFRNFVLFAAPAAGLIWKFLIH